MTNFSFDVDHHSFEVIQQSIVHDNLFIHFSFKISKISSVLNDLSLLNVQSKTKSVVNDGELKKKLFKNFQCF